MRLLLLHGPNLNMLGIREPGVYGTRTLQDLCEDLTSEAARRGHTLTCLQSNSEGALIDALHRAFFDRLDGVIFNPGAYTHYSYALYDAIRAIAPLPVVEVHLSDIHTRESFRQVSVTAPACIGQIAGQGEAGYRQALDLLEAHAAKGGGV